ncbi:hypothetical protein RvY_03188 [Ramazzottius varieornatus]|uniref:Uncharacterized protein n=1 Tax=Ramazzottius varieornatus TaxID=947166 RepID=A0A1D1UQY4_RAMVA|nr:hypothetical protein RvY_03188 [Ramazzottius varieornatus]
MATYNDNDYDAPINASDQQKKNKAKVKFMTGAPHNFLVRYCYRTGSVLDGHGYGQSSTKPCMAIIISQRTS